MAQLALRLLSEADARVDQHCRQRQLGGRVVGRLTLDPARAEATSLVAIHQALTPHLVSTAAAEAFGGGLAATVDAIIEHFPDNLFWDVDALAYALAHRSGHVAITAAFENVIGLIALYGRRTSIRFRYMHDFIYGFDWAKWVRRDPAARAGIGPYDDLHLAALERRGHELLALIEANDPKYARLRDSSARNPFGFSREPDAEIALHRALVDEQLVPVRAWALAATPVWDRPFADLRAARASARLDR